MTLHRKIEKTAAETELAALFDPAGASEARKAAFERFAALGLPSRRVESWHYTDLRAALVHAAPTAPAPDAAAMAEARMRVAAETRLEGCRLVLVDGHFVADLSDPTPAGVTLSATAPEASVSGAADPVLALAAALGVGLSLSVAEDADAGRIEILHLTLAAASASYTHVGLTLSAGARATLFERSLGAGAGSQRHRLTSLALAEGAQLHHVATVDDAPALHLESLSASLAEGAELSAFGYVAGGDLVRRQIFAGHHAPGAKIALAGLSLLDGQRRADTTLEVTHGAPNGQSREYFRHIVADEATGTYQGKVIVAQHAQKTDGGMKSQAILLSPNAVMNNKPELEIFADDVVCGHGATVGALDPEQVFYLQARGLPKAEAEAMLLEAFGVDAIDRVEDEEIAEGLRERMRIWLAARGR